MRRKLLVATVGLAAVNYVQCTQSLTGTSVDAAQAPVNPAASDTRVVTDAGSTAAQVPDASRAEEAAAVAAVLADAGRVRYMTSGNLMAPPASHPNAPSKCDPPYTVDENGHKKFITNCPPR